MRRLSRGCISEQPVLEARSWLEQADSGYFAAFACRRMLLCKPSPSSQSGLKVAPRRCRNHPLTGLLQELRGGMAGLRPEGVDQLPVTRRQRVLRRHQMSPPEVGQNLR